MPGPRGCKEPEWTWVRSRLPTRNEQTETGRRGACGRLTGDPVIGCGWGRNFTPTSRVARRQDSVEMCLQNPETVSGI